MAHQSFHRRVSLPQASIGLASVVAARRQASAPAVLVLAHRLRQAAQTDSTTRTTSVVYIIRTRNFSSAFYSAASVRSVAAEETG